MAYNLESLVKIIDQVLHPDKRCRWIIDSNKEPQIESLLKTALFLKEFFGNSSPLTSFKIESLESRIRDAAHEAEDILESHILDRIRILQSHPIRSVLKGVWLAFSPPCLQKVIGEFDSAKKEIEKMMDESHISSPAAAASSRTDQNAKKIMVGLSQDSMELKDRLTRPEAKLEIIPIVGMGGIGKTTLARYIYDDLLILSHFDTRAWITVSQEYNIRVILLGLLECVIGKLPDAMRKQENEQLGVDLHKSLRSRRYIIVLDDLWDDKAWDEINRFFPDDKNGSRALVTTRETSVANYAGSNTSPHQMHLLNEDDSWNLLREKVFALETCPPELERIGEKIATDCRGLPLAIHVIGGLLAQAKRTHESWSQVAKDVSSVVANNDEQFSKILSLSYNHLPSYIKPCFLYMSAFPEDYEIRSSYLIRLWVAEGFLEPISDKSLEEVAEMCLKGLVDRNLILVRQQQTNGIVKSYGMHDLLRDLCIRKASQEKFLCVKKLQVHNVPTLRRVSVHSSYRIRDMYDSIKSMALARSFICVGRASQDVLSFVFFKLVLLRVLDIHGIEFYKFPLEILELVNLRYLAFACRRSLPSSIASLWNLQTIIFRQISRSPILFKPTQEIFRMSHLRHIKFQETYPIYDLPFRKLVLQENLQTLSGITVDKRFSAILGLMPNLKKGQYVLSHLIFPPSLKKLTMQKCRIPLGCMNKIGSLPNLEVLKLRESILESTTWEPAEGEFSNLQFLLLENLNLVNWIADETHFPRLKNLVIQGCSELEEIPLGIGEIPTLELIEVHASNPSVVASTRQIREEQLVSENDGLQVLIKGSLI